MKEVDYKGAHGNFCSDEVFPDFLIVCENVYTKMDEFYCM